MQSIAETIAGYIGNVNSDNATHKTIARAALAFIERECLPHGSGFDMGCKIDLERSKQDKIVITTSYHHMDQNGYYAGWTDHTITVRPSFSGIRIAIGGRDRNYFKESNRETFSYLMERAIGSLSYDPTEGQRFAEVLNRALESCGKAPQFIAP